METHDQVCPTCGMVSPPSAQRCDCGFSFDNYKQERPYTHAGPSTSAAVGAVIGLVVVLIGYAVTAWVGPTNGLTPTLSWLCETWLFAEIAGLILGALIGVGIHWLRQSSRGPA